jgi:hypothetical protein
MRYTGTISLLALASVLALGWLTARDASSQQGARFEVNATHDAVDAAPGDGVCADAAGACTLRAAVMESNAVAGLDFVGLGAGTYTLNVPGVDEDLSATGDLDITDDIDMHGDSPEGTVIDGAQLDRIFHVDPLSTGAFAIFHTMTIRNGSAVSSTTGTADERGGGVLSQGNMELWFSAVTSNEAGLGGGVYGLGRVSIIVTDVRDNRAVAVPSGAGGGVYAEGELVVAQSNISDNSAVLQGGGTWGEGPLEVTLSSISDNRTEAGPDKAGGGIHSTGDLTVKRSTIARNTSSRGGGIFSTGTADLERSTVDANDATIGGGGIYNEGTITIRETTMSGNSFDAFSNPGSEAAPGTVGNATVTNSTVSGNLGGIGNGGTLALTNVTIAENTGVGLGAGTIGNVTMKNTIIGQNGVGDCTPAPGITSLGHNLDSDGTCSLNGPGDMSNVDPRLGPLAFNDTTGPGATRTHALLAGSPAIDGGDNAGCPPGDQRGFARPQDGNGDGNAVCDIGAFEAGSGAVVIPDPAPTPVASTPPATPAILPGSGGKAGGSGSVSAVVLAAIAVPVILVFSSAVWRARRRN